MWGSTRFVEDNLSTSDPSQSWSAPAKSKHTEKHVTSIPEIRQTIEKEKIQILFHLCRWFHSFEAWWYTSADPAWGKVNICFCPSDWTSIQINMFCFVLQLFKTLPNAQQIQEVEFFCFELNQQNKSMFNFARFCIVGLSSRLFDLLNSMIYDLKRFIDLRWLVMSGAIFIVRWSCFVGLV